jgi:hypothetical protein
MSPSGREKRTVIARLRGGLGNQMFQYALGRCIAEKENRELLLETKGLEVQPGITARTYALDIFRISARIMSSRQAHRSLAVPVHAYIVERTPGFCQDVLKPSPFLSIHLNGFWQSEKYFKSIAPVIRREFRFKRLGSAGRGWKAAILSERSPVCVHVRRQDYLAPQGRYIGFVGSEYYRRAVDVVARRVANPHFFIFSDDLVWCEKSLKIGYPHSFVRYAGSDDNGARDLELMTMCKHFIIANSSFSWWAAWLSENPRKMVVAPARWFAGSRLDSRDLVPDTWTRV